MVVLEARYRCYIDQIYVNLYSLFEGSESTVLKHSILIYLPECFKIHSAEITNIKHVDKKVCEIIIDNSYCKRIIFILGNFIRKIRTIQTITYHLHTGRLRH